MNALPITIRRARPSDAAAFTRLMGDPEVLAQLMQLPFPSEESWRERLAGNDEPGRTDLALVAERDGTVVGTAGLHPVGPALRRRHVMMLGISVAREAQRQGVAKALMASLCDYADRWGQVLRIELQVFADNVRAISLYRSFGFELEGRHPAYALRDGQYVESLSMARLHPHPPQIR